MGLLKNITKRQNIYTIQNNSENGKSSQAHRPKIENIKNVSSATPLTTHVIYLVHSRLDLDSQI